MVRQFSHDNVPQALSYIIQRLDEMDAKVDSIISTSSNEPQDKWLNIDDLCNYLPQRPARQTVYGWTSTNQIPYHKSGKNIIFLKSEIDKWLIGETIKCQKQIADEAAEFIYTKRRRL